MDASDNAASNLTPLESETSQTPRGRAAKRRRVPLPKPLKRAITQAATALRKDFVISNRLLANRAGRAFVRALYPRGPGRSRRADVTKALRLEAEGNSNKEIYRLLRKDTSAEQRSLREAMRQRKLRDRRRTERDKPSPPVTPTNSN